MALQRWPNLFLVGPHKTGTTSWYHALDVHPEVFMSRIKEPEFLNQDHAYNERPVESLDGYLALFKDAGDAVRRGEASPWYFYSRAAVEAIRSNAQDPRVLITLRDPVERLYSLHSQRVVAGTEPIETFEDALQAEPARRQGENLPDRANPVLGNFYREIARYAPSLERYLDAFSEAELKVLRFEEFIRHPEETYREVCRFLGVDDQVEPGFPQSNPNTEVRSHAFRDWVRDPPEPVQSVTSLFPVRWRDALRRVLLDANQARIQRDPIPPALRAELIEELSSDIDRIEELLGWDCSAWRRVDEPRQKPEKRTVD